MRLLSKQHAAASWRRQTAEALQLAPSSDEEPSAKGRAVRRHLLDKGGLRGPDDEAEAVRLQVCSVGTQIVFHNSMVKSTTLIPMDPLTTPPPTTTAGAVRAAGQAPGAWLQQPFFHWRRGKQPGARRRCGRLLPGSSRQLSSRPRGTTGTAGAGCQKAQDAPGTPVPCAAACPGAAGGIG